MTLATFSKSWHCMPSFAEVARVDVATTNKQTLLDVFGVGGAFIGGAPTPFGGSAAVWYDCATGSVSTPSAFPTVRQTCDASNVSAIGQNLLDGTSKFVFGTAPTARTWAVYELAELECEILLACQTANGNASIITMMVAPYGVTGSRFGSVIVGTTTVLPTATNAFTVISAAQWGGSANSNAGFKWHLWRSTDGLAYRFVTCNGGEPNGALFIERPTGAPAAWSKPVAAFWLGGNASTNVFTLANMNTSTPVKGYANGAFSMAVWCPHARSSFMSAVTKANGVSNEWAMIPQGLDSGDANNDGGMGELVDVRWGAMPPALPSGRVSKAQVSPAMLAGRWVKMGGFWLPGVPGVEFGTS